MSNEPFLQVIKYRMPKMTKSEKKIAQYVLNNFLEVINKNISELSDVTCTSDASVIRFCRSLGCVGYQDFKIKLAQEATSEPNSYSTNLEEYESAKTIAHKVFQTGISALQETLQTLSEKNINEAAKQIINAKKIMIICSGNSLIVGHDLKIKLLKIGVDCFMESDIDLQFMQIANITSDDLVICVSHTGSTKTVYDLVKKAKEKGAHVMLLCAQMKSPIGRLADTLIPVCGKESFFSSESSSARLAELAVCDAIFTVIASKNVNEYNLRLEKSRHETAKNKF